MGKSFDHDRRAIFSHARGIRKSIDTSLIATDQINNTSTMNALWDFGVRPDRSGLLAHRSADYAKDYAARYGHNEFEKVSDVSATMSVLSLQSAPPR
jgi:hypothetical protein